MMNSFFKDIWQEILQYYDVIVAIIPKIVLAIVVIVIAWLVARLFRNFSDKRLKQQMEDPLLAAFLATMVRIIIFIVGLLFAFKILGLSGVTSSILAGAGITAFVIGFALRDIGENFLAGILMAFKRPFRIGDFVETGAIKGRVIALNIRDTQIKTPDGKDVYIPNASIIKNPLINYTIDGFLRFDFVVSIPATADQEKIMQEIALSVTGVDGVLKNRRKVSVNISGIGPGHLNLTVTYWVDTFKSKGSSEKIRSDVIQAVQFITKGLG